jgi:hypothetical protein
MGQQGAQGLELALPMARQALQQGVHLRWAHVQLLKELQQQTDFSKGQANDVHQMSDLRNDLQAEFAASQNARDDAIALVGATIDLVSNQHGAALFQAPDRPHVGQAAALGRDPFGKHSFGAFGLRNLVLRTQPGHEKPGILATSFFGFCSAPYRGTPTVSSMFAVGVHSLPRISCLK